MAPGVTPIFRGAPWPWAEKASTKAEAARPRSRAGMRIMGESGKKGGKRRAPALHGRGCPGEGTGGFSES
ncbi:hypothetical protein GCM10025795_01120 [Verticiella sediminum]